MPKLYLLRHAQADGGFNAPDKERLLTEHGIKQSKAVAPRLNDISKVICSDATRTKMTFEAMESVRSELGQNIQFMSVLYNAPAGDLLNAIHEQNNVEGDVLLIAHNPGIHQLANILAFDDGSENLNRLMYGYAPASLSVFECDITQWKDLKPNQNKLVELIIPE